jgi:hypothetical protein
MRTLIRRRRWQHREKREAHGRLRRERRGRRPLAYPILA